MNKALRLKKDEPLHEWCDRIAEHYNFGDELREVLGEVCKTSYIKGGDAVVRSMKGQ